MTASSSVNGYCPNARLKAATVSIQAARSDLRTKNIGERIFQSARSDTDLVGIPGALGRFLLGRGEGNEAFDAMQRFRLVEEACRSVTRLEVSR